MDEETLASLLIVVRLGIVTILIWVLSRFFDLWKEWERRKKSKDAFIRSINAEVAFNTYDMSRFLGATVSVQVLENQFSDKAFIPHITDARHTDIYRNKIGDLHALRHQKGMIWILLEKRCDSMANWKKLRNKSKG